MNQFRTEKLPFKPRARIMPLLGDQLIRDPGIAVFELVKNAYDADSPDAKVMMSRVTDKEQGLIVVEDSGTGMDFDTVTKIWLEPGTDHRLLQRLAGERTPKFDRLPLGEKGVGRFAAHKLGHHITLITRKKNLPEVVVEIDWENFLKHKYLSDVPIEIREQKPKIFSAGKTGTGIEVRNLRNVWTRGMVRDLNRAVTSICSPFDLEGDFKAKLVLAENKDWLEGLLTVDQVLEYALFRAHCDIRGRQLLYEYEFRPFPAMDRVKSRKVDRMETKNAMNLSIDDTEVNILEKKIGSFHIDLYLFDLEAKILALGVSDRKGLKHFLQEAGGVRVYRDGIRVYDYGEPGNDWLDLGGQRVNVPTKRISNNLVIGAVSLEIEKSSGLIEKTNREGFVDNEVFRIFKNAVEFAITQIVTERNEDKKRIRNAYSGDRIKEPVLTDLTELRELVERKKLTKELGAYMDRIEADFVLIRDRFLTSASAGLSLSVVIHEVEKGVAELVKAVENEQASPRVKRLAKHLADLVEGFGALIRRSGVSREKADSMITQALFNTELRLKLHGISTMVDNRQGDFEIKCSRRLIISTLMNLIDNSIWWLDNKWGQVENKKRIYIGTSRELSGGPAIVVADNGPGFIDPPEYLVEPFISRKPDGMGLGLHIADQVMKVQGGKLEFPEPGDLTLPKGFDSAVVALVFGGMKK
jgi:signal transduction histidine kinase